MIRSARLLVAGRSDGRGGKAHPPTRGSGPKSPGPLSVSGPHHRVFCPAGGPRPPQPPARPPAQAPEQHQQRPTGNRTLLTTVHGVYGARRHRLLPRRAPADVRYVRFAYSTHGALNPENFRKYQKKGHMAYMGLATWQAAPSPPLGSIRGVDGELPYLRGAQRVDIGGSVGTSSKGEPNMRSRFTGRLSLLILSFAIAMIVFPAVAFGETVASDGTTQASVPTIQSDKDDYDPGALVTLTG